MEWGPVILKNGLKGFVLSCFIKKWPKLLFKSSINTLPTRIRKAPSTSCSVRNFQKRIAWYPSSQQTRRVQSQGQEDREKHHLCESWRLSTRLQQKRKGPARTQDRFGTCSFRIPPGKQAFLSPEARVSVTAQLFLYESMTFLVIEAWSSNSHCSSDLVMGHSRSHQQVRREV